MGKQQNIPGTDDDLVPEIEEAAEAVRNLTAKRKKVHEDELAARSVLIATLEEHKRESYRYEGADGKMYTATLKKGDVRVSVRREAPPKVAAVEPAADAQAAE